MTAQRPQPRPGVLDIEAYVPGKSTAPGVAKVFKLSSNETPLGPSPKAVEAYRARRLASAGLSGRLVAARCARRSGACMGSIRTASSAAPAPTICSICSRAPISPTATRRSTPLHGFLVYPIVTLGAGAKPVVTAEKNFTADVDAILKAVTPKTKMVFFANPNNPTGTYIPFDEVKRLHRALPPHVLLVIDAAYAEYVRRNDYESGIELVATSDNVVMTRTFSKIYGLAALRLGWMYGPAPCRGCDQPHPRAVQCQLARDRGRHRRARRHRAYRKGARA